MGWRERDYSHETWTERASARPGLGWPARAATVLIVLHVIALIAVNLVASAPEGVEMVRNLSLSGQAAWPIGIVLHPWASRNVMAVALTAVAIWLLGSYTERRLGSSRLLVLYLVGNVTAGAAFFLIARSWPRLAGLELDYPVGALSAWGVTALRSSAAETTILLGRVRRLWHIAVLGVVLCLALTAALERAAALGWLTAVAGGAVIEPPAVALLLLSGARHRTGARRAVRPSVPRESPPAPPPSAVPEIDDILAKISAHGLASLTPGERARLEAAREAMLHQPSKASGQP